jgi:hypothetical protein
VYAGVCPFNNIRLSIALLISRVLAGKPLVFVGRTLSKLWDVFFNSFALPL